MPQPICDVHSRKTIIFILICLAAWGIRLGFLLAASDSLDTQQIFSIDALAYHQIAQNVVEHGIFTSKLDPPYNAQLPSTFRPPLTPFFLIAIYAVFGVNLLWGQIGLATINALSCGLIYLFGEHLFGRHIGVIAGIISCGYPLFLLLTYLPLTEGISLFLTLALLLCLYIPPRSLLGWTLTVGILFGLGVLNKATHFIVFPGIVYAVCFFLKTSWRKRILMLTGVCLIAMGLIFPWAIRNQRITGTFTPINSNGGWTFYLGNNPYTEKNLADLERGASNGWIPPKEVFLPFADLSFADTKNYEKRSIQLGIAFIREQPGMFLNFAWHKLKIFWSPYSHIFDQLTWYPILALSILGGWYSRRQWKQHAPIYLLIALSTMIPIFFTSMPRFRAPIMPFLIIYAAHGLLETLKIPQKQNAGMERG